MAFEYVTTYNAPLIIKEKRPSELTFNFYGGCGLHFDWIFGVFLTAEYVSKALIIYFPFVSTDTAIATEMLAKQYLLTYQFISSQKVLPDALISHFSQPANKACLFIRNRRGDRSAGVVPGCRERPRRAGWNILALSRSDRKRKNKKTRHVSHQKTVRCSINISCVRATMPVLLTLRTHKSVDLQPWTDKDCLTEPEPTGMFSLNVFLTPFITYKCFENVD